jgi:error-prone DNA polymerase
VRGIGADLADRIVAARRADGEFSSLEDLVRRVPDLSVAHLEALATAGAFGESLGLDRRQALWLAGSAARARPGTLPGTAGPVLAPRLPGMTPVEEAVADLWATGVSPDGHPTTFLRDELARLGVSTSVDLQTHEPGRTVVVAGVVTHRQRPMTARGTTFMNLEDETGLVNVVVSVGCWQRFRTVARGAPALVVRGRLERSEGVVNVVAEHLRPLPLAGAARSRDFR